MQEKIIIKEVETTSLYAVLICVLASTFYVYDYFVQVSPSVMTNALMRSFSIGAGELGLLSACFYLSYTLMQIPAGLLLDRIGARVLITLSVLASAIGVTLFGVTYNFAIAGMARFITGFGFAFSFVSSLFLISRWFPHRHFTMAAGMVQMAGCLGSLIGLAPLAEIVNELGWRRTSVLTGLITFAFSFLFWIFVRDGKAKSPALTNKPKHSEMYRLKYLLKKRQIWWLGLLGVASWIPVAIIGALWGVPFFMKAYGLTNIEAGKLCSLFWVGLGVGSPLVGWVSNRMHNRNIPLAMCFLSGLVGSVLILDAPRVSLLVSAFALILLGLASSSQALSFGVIKDIVPPNFFGTAVGINNMSAVLGGAVSQPLVGYLLHIGWNGLKIHNLPIYSIDNYRMALLILPISALVGFAVVFLKIKETHCEMRYTQEKQLDLTDF